MSDFDDLIIGAGMAGLTVASLLARSGRRVLVLEAHDVPGGYAHTFRVGKHRFCAQVHYIFNCGEGESIHRLLSKLGAVDRVPFERLDPEGFDHIVVGGVRVRVPNGLAKYRERLARRFPAWRAPIEAYFAIVTQVGDELDAMQTLPRKLTPWVIAKSAWRHRHLLRYLRSTLENVFDAIGMPPLLRAILAGQCGDYLLPPRDVSFLLHVALVCGYDRGAYYPKHHFFHFIETLASAVSDSPGCAILFEHEVSRIEVSNSRVTGVVTKAGKRFTASRYISNMDPRRTVALAGPEHFSRRDADLTDYTYSAGAFTLYLAVEGLDLREHGFGSFNVWHYPHEDINRIYDDQLVRHDLSNPWLFMSTPTLHTAEPGLCPPGQQVLEVATVCDYRRWAELRRRDRRAYNVEKKRVRETVLDVIEARYVPRLRDHMKLRVAGTPATNERFCRAPEGNSYGSALVPKNMRIDRGPTRTSVDNLWLVNATCGFPSIAGTAGAGIHLYEELTGDRVG
ncbi:MAG: NAD(P)/FAD-dependent oxidoreductase [Polyangiaceae bacterium]|nr:NAD(P)/FAD-dependent oxidoreductase [Polyangiaceae bacterium]